MIIYFIFSEAFRGFLQKVNTFYKISIIFFKKQLFYPTCKCNLLQDYIFSRFFRLNMAFYLFLFNLYKKTSQISTILFSCDTRKNGFFSIFYTKKRLCADKRIAVDVFFYSIKQDFKPRFFCKLFGWKLLNKSTR